MFPLIHRMLVSKMGAVVATLDVANFPQAAGITRLGRWSLTRFYTGLTGLLFFYARRPNSAAVAFG